MNFLIYNGSFEGFLTALFEVYEYKLYTASIRKAGVELPQLFTERKEVITNIEKADRVWRKIERIVGQEAEIFFKVWLSELDDVEDCLLGVVRYLVAHNINILSDYGNPHVLRLQQTLKMIGREKHRMEAFVRFQLTKDGLYYASIEPDFNVLPLIFSHFESRYADQRWLIHDVKRDYAIYYDLHKTEYVHFESNNEQRPSQEVFNEKEGLYQQLWQDYFSSTNIRSRKNTKLHLRHAPKRYWKYLTEKKRGE